MRYDATHDLTYYVISAPEADECVMGFQKLLDLAVEGSQEEPSLMALLQHPLEAHIILSKILCESSQGYINLFRQSMFAQVTPPPEGRPRKLGSDLKSLASGSR